MVAPGARCRLYAQEMTRPTRKVRYARRRKRRLGLVENDLTALEWSTLQAAWGGCAYCGASDRALQKDCVLPISRGGRYTLDNVVPACGSCNASKCNVEVVLWLRRKKLDERAFLLRHAQIRAGLDRDERPDGPRGEGSEGDEVEVAEDREGPREVQVTT